VERARTLAGRRAWVDVLAVTGDLLHGRTSPCGRWYRVLSGEDEGGEGGGKPVPVPVPGEVGVGVGDVDNNGDDGAEEEAKQRAETNELLRLRLTAYLRLRKTVDLAREVERLNLLDDDVEDDENDQNGESNANARPTARDDTTVRKRRAGGLPLWVDMSVTILAATSLLYTDPGSPRRCLDALHRIRVEIVNTGRRRRRGGGGGSGDGDLSLIHI